jgi:Uma2 family endonuclease
MTDYESIGISEYWIVDYLGIGGRRYIGSPKQPTITICKLVKGEYELELFRQGDRILSTAFPELNLMAEQVFAAGI